MSQPQHGHKSQFYCKPCAKSFGSQQALTDHQARSQKHLAKKPGRKPPSTEADWESPCSVCGSLPTVSETGMCGPCTFGEADTVGGNW